MPTGSSFEHIHSDYRQPHETSSSSIQSSARSNQTAEYIGSDRERRRSSSDPNKSIILSKFFNGPGAGDCLSPPYENLCSGCGYGVFEARGKLCNFCRYVALNDGYLEDNSNTNIYENICDKCSGLYGSGSECAICFKNNNTTKVNSGQDNNDCLSTVTAAHNNNNNNKKSTSKKSKKRFFNSLLGSLKRVKSFKGPAVAVLVKPAINQPPTSSSTSSSAATRKLQIVHNVDGYDNVFRTNETFDLNRICELKQLKASTSDHHIYGKLRKINDDHLQATYECVKQKSQSDDYLISGTGCEQFFRFRCTTNSRPTPTPTVVDNDDVDSSSSSLLSSCQWQAAEVLNSVGEWMTSLRCETHDYYSFGAPDTVLCNPKSIPANFGVGSSSSSSTPPTLLFPFLVFPADEPRWLLPPPSATSGRSQQVAKLRSCSNESDPFDFEQQMVNEFKRSLMEKQEAHHGRAKRQGIYLKLDSDSDDIESKQRNYHQVSLVEGGDHQNSDRNCLSPSSAQARAQPAAAGLENSRRGVAHQLNKRCCIYEKDSEFVSDILQAFDSFLHRESEVGVRDVEDEVQSEVITRDCTVDVVVSRQEQSVLPAVPPPAGVDIEQIIQQLALSRGLNRLLITYDLPLKVFLSGVGQVPHLSHLSFPRLAKHFRRFQVFVSRPNIPPAIEHIPDTTSSTPVKEEEEAGSIMTVPHHSTPISKAEEKEEDEEPIYQPIWKFKTVGEVRESYITDEHYYGHLPSACDSSASIPGVDIEDHDEWEPDDEFTFTTKLDGSTTSSSNREPDTLSVNTTQSSSGSTITGYASSVSTMTIASTSSVTHHYFRNICIFYSLKEPAIRAVLYEYDRNRCSSYFAQQPPPVKQRPSGRGASDSLPPLPATSTSNGCDGITPPPKKRSESGGGRMFADSVQAWKYMLLDVNYLEDEEDMYVSVSQIKNAQTVKDMELKPPSEELQKFKSQSSGDLTQEEDKKSITERMRNKLQRGVFKLQAKTSKENKKSRNNPSKRNDTFSLYSEEDPKPKYPIFKAPLEQLEMNETTNPDVPRFVVDCIEYIEAKDCIQMDGLYRASGNKLAIDELKQKLTKSCVYDKKLLITDDIHTLTSLLKQFFRELPTPLIPQDTYQRLAETRNLMDPSAMETIKPAILEMKNPNRATLQFLIKHLTMVAHYSCENRMPASNLAIVWGPCILSANQIEYDIAKMNTLAKVLIENYDKIFGDNERLVS